MPLLGIAIAQSSFPNYLCNSRVQLFINGRIPNYEYRWSPFRRSFQKSGYLNYNLGHVSKKLYHKFFVKSVATLEPKYSVKSKDEEESIVLSSAIEQLSSAVDSTMNEDSEDIDEREKLRRIRISKANKGNTPWNKGRKHSPETRQRIRERTRLAMQNPKVKMKLANIGHAQSPRSPETREKIAVGVRMGWQKRRERLMLQEACLFDWQNLVAEAARKGFQDQEELQWNSYEIINEQLQLEWLASIEQRKKTPKPKISKRAPKSLEQRKKIAAAIAAKWADPEYRSKVTTGLAKYHGIPEGAERKRRKKPSDSSQSPKTPNKKVGSAERSAATVKTQQSKLKKKTTPKYKDPLANSKFEMLKNIRAQRVASEVRKNEALERAKLLIAEAEKAAKALEIAATRSPVARASLIEARELIAEATQSIESIENEEVTSQDDPKFKEQNHVGKDENQLADDTDEGHHRGVNGTDTRIVQTTNVQSPDNGAYNSPTLEEIVMNRELQSQIDRYELAELDFESFKWNLELEDVTDQQCSPELNGAIKLNGLSSHHSETKLESHEQQDSHSPVKPVTKKWVRGRLVEVAEDE